MLASTLFTAALGLFTLATAAPAPLSVAAAPIKIMPFGASIVEITCWRAYLWKKIHDAGVTNVDFVGSHATPSGNCTLNSQVVPFDKDNEGHSGALVTDYAAQNSLPPWLASANPDIIIMHVGTNDATAKLPTSQVMSAYDTVLAQMRARNPKITLILSKLIPVDPKLFGQETSDLVVEYNDAMDGWVERNSNARSPIVLVDMYTGFDDATMTREGEHPNEKGDVFMADRFFPVVMDRLVKVTVERLMS